MQFSGQTVAGSVNFRKPISGSNMTGYTFWYCLCCPLFLIIGHVGPPLPCNKIKLVDVPEMEYYAKDGKGEVRKSLNPTWRIFFLSQKWVTISTLSYFVLIGSFWCHVIGLFLRAECVQGIPVWWGEDERKYRRGWLASLGGRGRMATSEYHRAFLYFHGASQKSCKVWW